MEDDAVSAFGVGPSDSTLLVADHVTSSAFEAVLIIEQNATITSWNKEVCRTGHDAFTCCASSTRIAVDRDVGAFVDPKLRSVDALLKGYALPGAISFNSC